MGEEIQETLTSAAKKVYGDKPLQCISKRIEEELEEFREAGLVETDLFELKEIIENEIRRGNLLLPRMSISNSLVYFMFGLTGINPLPRHTYCSNCHAFYWGGRNGDSCPVCGEKLTSDGFDLPFGLLKDDIRRSGFKFNFASEREALPHHRICQIKLQKSPLVQLAANLKLTQNELKTDSEVQSEVIACLNPEYYATHYQKEPLFKHHAFVGIQDLGSGVLQQFWEECPVSDFDEAVALISLMHGTQVYDSCALHLRNETSPSIKDYITSRDDLFSFLKANQFSDEETALMCRETRLHGEGRLTSLSETKLMEAGVERKYIDFMKGVRYLPCKGQMIGLAKLEFAIAKIYLEDPMRYYGAYFLLNKKLISEIGENDDFIKGFVEAKNTEYEPIYLGIVDLIERGFHPRKVLLSCKLKAMGEANEGSSGASFKPQK